MLGALLFSPIKGLGFVFREIVHAAEEAREADRRRAMAELQDLHRQIERGTITEAEFEARETTLLDRLEALSAREGA